MCNRNFFFEDDTEGADFCTDKPGLVIFSVSDGFDLARQLFIEHVLKLAM